MLDPGWKTLIEECNVPPHKTIKGYLDHICSEVLEAYKESDFPKAYWDLDGKPEGFGPEMADIIILSLACCMHFGIDIQEALDRKLEYLRKKWA